jgi:hypothetical protein
LAIIFWLASILGIGAYAVFGCPDLGFGLAYRTVNFLWPPAALLCALGLKGLYSRAGGFHNRRIVAGLTKAAGVLAFLAIVLVNIFNVYAAVSLEERYMGYFWLYKAQEYEAGSWTSAFTYGNGTIAGDVKASYLLKDYFNLKVDVFQGLKYLAGKGDLGHELLYIYGQMLRNGYVLGGSYSVDLPRNWTERLYVLSLLYSNGPVSVYGG